MAIGGMPMQFRSSSQLAAVDRTLGSLAVIGVSALVVRWLTSGRQTDEEKQQQNTWWWPILALRRRRKKQTDKDSEGDGSVPDVDDNDGVYSHQGSCHW